MEVITKKKELSHQIECVTRMLRQVLEQQTEMNESIKDLRVLRDALVRDIKLDNITLEAILEVSDSTLYRWRNAPAPNNLPYYMRDNGSIYYDFDEVMKAIRRGNFTARGFRRMKAIENMNDYRNNVLNTKGSGSWFISNK